MHRQLMDAQRLIRIILGKPLNKDQNPLGANSILQAIRSFALMKAELIELRKKQEIIDGDPPAILQTLGSPAVTTPSTARTGACVLRRLDVQSQINDGHKTCEPTDIASPVIVTNTDAPINSDIEHAQAHCNFLDMCFFEEPDLLRAAANCGGNLLPPYNTMVGPWGCGLAGFFFGLMAGLDGWLEVVGITGVT